MIPCVSGKARLYSVLPNETAKTTLHIAWRDGVTRLCPCVVAALPGVWRRTTDWQSNASLYDAASAITRQLADGGTAYKVNSVYIEYQNVADPEAPITPPAIDPAAGVSYYDGLAASPDTDYLRVPLISAVRSSTDESKYPDGNVATFFARTQGVVGVHGKAFSDVANSKVYGLAVAAVPDPLDRTRDLVIGRLYLAADKQQVKLATGQIGVEYPLTVEIV